MLAVFLLIPFLLIRFPLLGHFGKNALSRAAYFAPVQGKEKIAYMIYQLSNLALFITPVLLEIKFVKPYLTSEKIKSIQLLKYQLLCRLSHTLFVL